jgi:hypothetical protein
VERKLGTGEVRERLIKFADEKCRDLEEALGITDPENERNWRELIAFVKMQTKQLADIKRIVQ